MPLLRFQQPRAPWRCRRGSLRRSLSHGNRPSRRPDAGPGGALRVFRRRHAVAYVALDRAAILEAIAKNWSLAPDVEISLEANPTSVEASRFRGFKSAGVNRVSLGIQALNDIDLKNLGRQHSVAEALAALNVANSVFSRTSFDLIYARPGQTPASWRKELDLALAYAPEHVSLYQLTIEPDTMFERMFNAGKLVVPDMDTQRALWDVTQEATARVACRPMKSRITPGRAGNAGIISSTGAMANMPASVPARMDG